MRVLAITVNFRTPELTMAAVRAELGALGGASLDARIVVVDNDSGDGSYERLVEDVAALGAGERVTVLASGRNGGFGFGNNVAIRAAMSRAQAPDFVHLFNSDSEPDADAVTELLAALERHPDVGIAGSRITTMDGRPHQSAFHFPSWQSELDSGLALGVVTRLIEHGRPNLEHLESSTLVDWVSGCSLMLRTTMLERVGLFDEGFFLYFEETDLCRRARDAGYRSLYVHESVVRHVGGASTGIYARDRPAPSYWFDSRARYFRKHHGTAYLHGVTLLLAGGWVSSIARYALQRKPPRSPPRFVRDLARHAAERALSTRA